jgi:hypothetical protein
MTKNVAWKASVPGHGWSSPIAVFDAQTGHQIHRARVGGPGNTFSASPWTYGGKVFCLHIR